MTYEFPTINYIGNKDKLSDWIVKNFPENTNTVLDLFSGGGSVAYALKLKGYTVTANDVLYSSLVVNKALIENKKIILAPEKLKKATNYPLDIPRRKSIDWLSDNLYYSNEVDELSKLVDYSFNLFGYQKYLFLSLLRRSMIRKLPYSRMNIDWKNIVKLRNEDYSYQKYGRRRAYHNKSFLYHMLKDVENYNEAVFDNNKKNLAVQLDAFEAIKKYGSVDVVYMDPPYPGTMNNYEGFYGSYDKIFDKKITYYDWTKSYDFLVLLEKALELSSTKAKYLILSINTNTKPSYKDVINLFSFYGYVSIKKHKHNYQVSSKENKNKNTELLIIVKFYK